MRYAFVQNICEPYTAAANYELSLQIQLWPRRSMRLERQESHLLKVSRYYVVAVPTVVYLTISD